MASSVAEILLNHLDAKPNQDCLQTLLYGLKSALESLGLDIHRVQIPLTKGTGFRHPLYWGIGLTWSDTANFDDTLMMYHEGYESTPIDFDDFKNRTELHAGIGPYIELVLGESWFYQFNLETEGDLPYPILDELRQTGYRKYFIFKVSIPSVEFPQFISLSSRTSFPSNIAELIYPHLNTLALGIYAAYRTSQANKLADVYIGPKTGQRVLNGEITRHHSQTHKVGIMFCDIRNFTRLSEQLGSKQIVHLMNDIFDTIAHAATSQGGEILKFIGDAVLLIFDHSIDQESPFEKDQESPPLNQAHIAQSMVNVVKESVHQLELLAHQKNLPIAAGFGCHIGDVTYGNIGSKERLDFTVMGPTVNLTSRLEGLTKEVKTSALFTQSIAQYVPSLIPCGSYELKGISKPTPVWKLD